MKNIFKLATFTVIFAGQICYVQADITDLPTAVVAKVVKAEKSQNGVLTLSVILQCFESAKEIVSIKHGPGGIKKVVGVLLNSNSELPCNEKSRVERVTIDVGQYKEKNILVLGY